jgi:hypothetical protein
VSRACRDRSCAISQVAAVIAFDTLDTLASRKSIQAASLYKLLTFLFIENFDDLLLRETMGLCFA